MSLDLQAAIAAQLKRLEDEAAEKSRAEQKRLERMKEALIEAGVEEDCIRSGYIDSDGVPSITLKIDDIAMVYRWYLGDNSTSLTRLGISLPERIILGDGLDAKILSQEIAVFVATHLFDEKDS